MSETVADQPTLVTSASAERPPPVVQADRVLPILVLLSLVVHATMFLPSLLRSNETEVARPKEIAVELVQAPPAPKSAQPKPAQPKPKPKPAAPKPPVQKAEQKPPPKVAEKKAPAKPAQKSTAERLKDLLGPMPAIALPGTAADGGEAASYSQLVLSQVAKAKKEGRYRGTPGAASVSFTLGDTGDIAHVELVRPSGDPTLDTEAVAMVKRGAPYPPPPPGGRRNFTITLRFQALI